MVNKKEHEVEHHSHSKKINFWMVATIALGIILVASVIFSSVTKVSEKTAGQNLVDFAKSQGVELSIVDVKSKGSLYEITANIQGQQAPFYVTKDGKYFTASLVPLDSSDSTTDTNTNTPTQQSIPKSDKPKVELFVMSHCPYGTQVEKGILPVAGLLGDKIDFEIKFVYYAMHGKTEVDEQLSQYCIQKEQNDKYLNYLKCFLENGNTQACLTEANVDKTKLATCTAKADKEFDVTENYNDQASWLSGRFPKFDINKADNEKYNVAGSPTLIINGVEASTGRDSVSLLGTICGAFNTQPEECSKVSELDPTTPGPGFGWDSSGSANLAACGV